MAGAVSPVGASAGTSEGAGACSVGVVSAGSSLEREPDSGDAAGAISAAGVVSLWFNKVRDLFLWPMRTARIKLKTKKREPR